MNNLNKIVDTNTNVKDKLEEEFIAQLKSEIEQGKEDFRKGNFITHEEMLMELKRNKIIQ